MPKKLKKVADLGCNQSPPTPQATPSFPTVGIGASAGGIGALQAFFSELPADLGAAFVVIVHLDPEHQSELARIIGARTAMPVSQVNRKMTLEPDNVYVIPPNRRLLVTDHEIATFAFDEPRGRRSPIDQFYRSLADQHGDGFAVVLTGAGQDGALGVKAIKESGGLILVQEPADAEYPSMPRHAIATGMADFVLPVRDLARQLADLIRRKAHITGESLAGADEESLKRIFAVLRTRTGHDFSKYKRSTVYRRLARRLQVCRIEQLEDYYALLRSSPDEVQSLFADLLISVTTFFRDPSAFEVLAREVIPNLFAAADETAPIRVWVPGCATGEEPYSIAMLLAEEAARREARPEIQLFASDLDAGALAVAREGRFPRAIENDLGEERLRRFFTREGDHYRVKRDIRDMVLFATHSLLKDPPFSRLNLVSCRNLLIYLERDIQQQVLSTLHYALKRGGYLFLGSSESAETAPRQFKSINREARIYQSIKAAGEGAREIPRLLFGPPGSGLPGPRTGIPVSGQGQSGGHHRSLEQFAPPSILVDGGYRILNMSESAGRYILPSAGALPVDITELVRPELRFDLRAALYRAFERNETSLSLAIAVQFNGRPRRVYMQVRPLPAEDHPSRNALVLFFEGEQAGQDPLALGEDGEAVNGEPMQRLKEELELTRSRLRASREESEAANEELRAANEELQSINEEYRSTAEELETSKEELQSINEELQTVNAELKVKLENVSRVNSDLQNLMAANDIGTLFLDNELRIKRFTPRITDLFNISAPDEGRPITDFTNRLEYPQFADDARNVLQNLGVVEREIASGGRWFLTRLRPYRTIENRIDGVVVTFVDVTEQRQAAEAQKTVEARLRLVLRELSHRVKNTLAVVQSMARQSFREDRTRSEAFEIFAGRLVALSSVHDILVRSEWTGAELTELVHRQLAPYKGRETDRVSAEGPPVHLPPELATPLALVIHELATNATKYGALSKPGGTLGLTWCLDHNGRGKRLRLEWREIGGPAVTEPDTTGFGSYLIGSGLPGATVERDFKPEGLICIIDLPFGNEPSPS